MNDVQDGLFKLILYSNIHSMQFNNKQVSFSIKLKLTGKNIRNQINFPCSLERVEEFLRTNSTVFNEKEKSIIKKLLLETQRNENIKIEIKANH